MMKYLRLLSRAILGIVFIFSGFVKAVDPLGSAYKFSDYFHAFGLEFLDFSTVPLAVLLSAFEMTMGITLLLGYRRKVVYGILMWFMSFFTLLTFVLALFNPVSDCGCFGDALILTNWETFLKNLVLMVFVLLLYLNRKQEWQGGSPLREWSVAVFIYTGACFFSLLNYRHLPLLDFRPYDRGTVIRAEMEIPEDAPVDEYETEFIYRNRETGRKERFTIDNYPTDTVEWVFETSESKLLHKGYEPPIHDFTILDSDGMDVVQDLLNDRDYSLIMVSHDLNGADHSALIRAGGWSELEFLAGDFRFYAVTASTSGDVASISSRLELGYRFHTADDVMLKTMVRSNPGFILVKNGMIIGKWGFRDFPSVEELEQDWNDIMASASAPMDEELLELMDAGIVEDFSYAVIDFDRFMPALVFGAEKRRAERDVVLFLVLGILLLLLVSNSVEPVKLI